MPDLNDFQWVSQDELESLSRSFARWDLDTRQHVARVHMTEQFLRLLNKQERLIELSQNVAYRTISALRTPTAGEQQDIFEATQDFYLTFYTAFQAMVSFLNRLPKFTRKYGNVPHLSTGRAIKWARDLDVPLVANLCDVLDAARSFRAILDHPGGAQPYDWATSKLNYHGEVEVILFGEGKPPVGAVAESYLGEGDWHFVAPFFGNTVNAFWNLFTAVIGLAGRLYVRQSPGASFSRSPLFVRVERERPTLPTGIDDPRLYV